MASIPPAEVPAPPSQPAEPTSPPPEVGPNTPDIDIPDPAPGGDPFLTPGQPVD